MKYIKTYEGVFDFFKKKKEPKLDYDKIRQDPYWEPKKDNAYWKQIFKINIAAPRGGTTMLNDVELVMKFSHDDFSGYYFDGIWKTDFDWSKYYTSNVKINYVTKQEKAKEGDKSEEFSFGRGNWFALIEEGRIVKATEEEIIFYNLHDETNKYNL